MSSTLTTAISRFLSTPSARRATRAPGLSRPGSRYFYPRPPRGGRPLLKTALTGKTFISIHALREEGDDTAHRPRSAPADFYPRPPRGGRRPAERRDLLQAAISIHALREEGDARGLRHHQHAPHFYPRPPRGGRRVNLRPSRALISNFYPRPPRGGRPLPCHAILVQNQFLSTPSARRATIFDNSIKNIVNHFYPRPPRGGRPPAPANFFRTSLFLSTPSARRATAKTEKNISAFVSL